MVWDEGVRWWGCEVRGVERGGCGCVWGRCVLEGAGDGTDAEVSSVIRAMNPSAGVPGGGGRACYGAGTADHPVGSQA